MDYLNFTEMAENINTPAALIFVVFVIFVRAIRHAVSQLRY